MEPNVCIIAHSDFLKNCDAVGVHCCPCSACSSTTRWETGYCHRDSRYRESHFLKCAIAFLEGRACIKRKQDTQVVLVVQIAYPPLHCTPQLTIALLCPSSDKDSWVGCWRKLLFTCSSTFGRDIRTVLCLRYGVCGATGAAAPGYGGQVHATWGLVQQKVSRILLLYDPYYIH